MDNSCTSLALLYTVHENLLSFGPIISVVSMNLALLPRLSLCTRRYGVRFPIILN